MSFMPGFRCAVSTGGGPPPTLSLRTSAALTNMGATTITCPGTTQVGDLLVLANVNFVFSGSVTAVVPSGFETDLDSTAGGTNTRLIVSRKIAGSGDIGAALNLMAANGSTSFNAAILLVFAGPCHTANKGATWGDQFTDANPTSQTVAAGSSPAPNVIVLGSYANLSAGAISPRTMSPAKTGEVDGSIADGIMLWLAYKIYNSAPGNVSVDMDDEGSSNWLSSGYIYVT